MRETRDVSIDGKRFLVAPLPPLAALKLLNRLSRTAAPAMARLAGSQGFAALDLAGLGDALETLFDKLSPDEQESLLRELFRTVEVFNGDRKGALWPQFDAVFASDLRGVFELAREALEVNYGDFLGDLLARAKALGAGKASPSAESNTSTGASGG